MSKHKHRAMNVLGREFFPPMQPSYGGADNYFLDPIQATNVVWGGRHVACPDWVFARSIGFCNTATGDPSRVVHFKKRCILKALRVWRAESSGLVRIREWHNLASQRYTRLEFPVDVTVASSFEFGLYGVDIGRMPYVETTVKASIEVVFDIE